MRMFMDVPFHVWQPAVQYHEWLFERLPVVGGIDVELSV